MKINSKSKPFINIIILSLISLLYLIGLNVYFVVAVIVFSIIMLVKIYCYFKRHIGEILGEDRRRSIFFGEFVFVTFLFLLNFIGLSFVFTMFQFDMMLGSDFREISLILYLPLASTFVLIVGLANSVEYRIIFDDLKNRTKRLIIKERDI